MASTWFQHTPLSSESAFRLLRLKESSNLESRAYPIEIELFEAHLNNAPLYEAVSYAWDHGETPVSVLCNQQPLSVSPILLEMLNRPSRISSIGVFWIDAVCIDQTSTSDKNIQVPRMRDIFSEARKVWIWLGKGSNEIQVAFEFLTETIDFFRTGVNIRRTKKQPSNLSIKDKVYGLYGIFDHLKIQDLPPVDYTKSVQQPYMSDLPTRVPDYSNNDFIRFFEL
ncbi:hypothetical protein E8E11_005973 [Didymella keratinophila]|nr:hypothetical protein E8E11_005973 [Didymella keratinophila]